MQEQRTVHRYSQAFKHKVVSEIENGILTVSQARSLYGISGQGTIAYWMRRLGKAHLLNKVVHIADEHTIGTATTFPSAPAPPRL